MVFPWLLSATSNGDHTPEDLFGELGNMQPSKSSLDRLPKRLSEVWEAQRAVFESRPREEEIISADAVVRAVSLDGVMVPMKDGKRQAKQAQGKGLGRPNGYKEVACGTLSFFDAQARGSLPVVSPVCPKRRRRR